jgi:hypothetical protein
VLAGRAGDVQGWRQIALIPISTSRLGEKATCDACGAGKLLSFNWQYAQDAPKPEHRRDLSVFVHPVPLRFGSLYECGVCGQPWYLYGDPPFMNFVPPARMELIRRWNESEIALAPEHVRKLKAIGPTPPDIYGNRSQYCEVPCAVTTVDGARIELAVVSVQRHAPFERWRTCRLASEIAEVEPSWYALPQSVRVAASRAQEIRMGFAPTMVELPSGKAIALNWSQHFLVRPGTSAGDVRLSKRGIDMRMPPEVYNGTKDDVYFVADKPLLA